MSSIDPIGHKRFFDQTFGTLENPAENPAKKPKPNPLDSIIQQSSQEKFKHLGDFALSVTDHPTPIKCDLREPIDTVMSDEIFAKTCSDSFISSVDDQEFYESEDSLDLITLPKDWQEALDDLKEENSTLLIKLINGVIRLTSTEKSRVFEEILIEGDRELILLSTKMRLSFDDRVRLLHHGLLANDLDIVEAAINGDFNQKELGVQQFCKNKPFKFIQHYIQKGISPEIISKLCKIADLTKEEMDCGVWLKFLFNLWGLEKGEFMLHNEKIKYEGALIHFFHDKFLNALENFQLVLDPSRQTIIQELIFLIKSSDRSLSSKKRIQLYERNGVLLMHGGSSEHLIDFVFYKKKESHYLMICNMGVLSELPVEVLKINDIKEINVDMIKFIENQERISIRELKKYTLPFIKKKLNAQRDPLTDKFSKEWIGRKEQTGSDCISSSTKASLYALGGMHEEFGLVYEFWRFFEIWSLDKYLTFCKENLYYLDSKLIKRIFEKAKKEYIRDNNFLNSLAQVEEKYYELLLGIS